MLYKIDGYVLPQFEMYRFSIAWSRVLPNGTTDYVNQLGIQYYHDLIEELLAYNITPVVSCHYNLKHSLFNRLSKIQRNCSWDKIFILTCTRENSFINAVGFQLLVHLF